MAGRNPQEAYYYDEKLGRLEGDDWKPNNATAEQWHREKRAAPPEQAWQHPISNPTTPGVTPVPTPDATPQLTSVVTTTIMGGGQLELPLGGPALPLLHRAVGGEGQQDPAMSCPMVPTQVDREGERPEWMGRLTSQTLDNPRVVRSAMEWQMDPTQRPQFPDKAPAAALIQSKRAF